MINKKRYLKFWISRILQHMRKKNFQVDPLPTVKFIDTVNDPDNLFISTGNYDSKTRTVNLYIDGRHVKDILRSFCHEMVHHHQNLENSDYFRRVDLTGKIDENPELDSIESEAFLLGNKLFRSFTEEYTMPSK